MYIWLHLCTRIQPFLLDGTACLFQHRVRPELLLFLVTQFCTCHFLRTAFWDCFRLSQASETLAWSLGGSKSS